MFADEDTCVKNGKAWMNYAKIKIHEGPSKRSNCIFNDIQAGNALHVNGT